MISKEKKAGNHERICKKRRRYRFTGSTGCSSYSKNSGADRAFTEHITKDHHSRRGLLKMVGQRRGLAGIPEENRYRKIPCTD